MYFSEVKNISTLSLLLAVVMPLIISCKVEYKMESINITQADWEEISISESYAIEGFNPFASKEPDVSDISIEVFNGNDELISRSTTRDISIPDRELKSNERLTIIFKVTMDGHSQTRKKVISASPKRIKFYSSTSVLRDYSGVANDLEIEELREVFGRTGRYEVIRPKMKYGGLLHLDLEDEYEGEELLNTERDIQSFSERFMFRLRKKIYTSHQANLSYRYSVFWKGDHVESPNYSMSLELSPEFESATDGYAYTRKLAPFGAVFFSYYISSNDLGVFTLKNKGLSSDIDIFIYEDSDMSELLMSSKRAGTSNEICYADGGQFVFVKVQNIGQNETKAWLATHNVDLESVCESTFTDYVAQSVLKILIESIFDVKKDNKAGSHVADVTASVALSAFKGDDVSTMTEGLLANELCGIFTSVANDREEVNFMCSLAVNIAKEIYKYY